jgi:hypothetical protein
MRIALYISWLDFITVVESFYCAVRNEFLYKTNYTLSVTLQTTNIFAYIKHQRGQFDRRLSINKSSKSVIYFNI